MLITIYVRAPRLCTSRAQESDDAGRGRRCPGRPHAPGPAVPPARRVAHALLPLRGRATRSHPRSHRAGSRDDRMLVGSPRRRTDRAGRLPRDGHAALAADARTILLRRGRPMQLSDPCLHREGTGKLADTGARLRLRRRLLDVCRAAVSGARADHLRGRRHRRRGDERRGDLGRLVRRAVELRRRDHHLLQLALRPAGPLRRAPVRDAGHVRRHDLHADRIAGVRRRDVRLARVRRWSRCRCPGARSTDRAARRRRPRATAPRPCTRRPRRPRRRRSGRRRRRPPCTRPAPSRTAGGWSR